MSDWILRKNLMWERLKCGLRYVPTQSAGMNKLTIMSTESRKKASDIFNTSDTDFDDVILTRPVRHYWTKIQCLPDPPSGPTVHWLHKKIPSFSGKDRHDSEGGIVGLLDRRDSKEQSRKNGNSRSDWFPFSFSGGQNKTLGTAHCFYWCTTWFEIRSSNLTPNIEISKRQYMMQIWHDWHSVHHIGP